MAEKFIADKNIHDGHRGRMRAKFLAHGSDIFDTYELLEILLYNVIPYKDTNPIAKRLLCAFGSLDGVFCQDKDSLMKVEGVGEKVADYIILTGKLPEILDSEPLVKKSAFCDYHKIGNFFVEYYKDTKNYKVSMLLLDNNMMPISVTDFYNTDCNSGAITPEPFITEAIKSNASIAILAHTHPYSTLTPCRGDLAANALLHNAFSSIGINLLDHYIICGNEYKGFMEHPSLGISAVTGIENFTESKSSSLSAYTQYPSETIFDISGTTEGSYEVQSTAGILYPILGEKSIESAHKLYIRYFSLERALTLPTDSLAEIIGNRCAFYLKLLAKITSRRITDSFEFGITHSDEEITKYFKGLFIGEPVEKLYVMSLDTQRHVISCDLVNEGTVNFASVSPRKILEAALEHKARYIIISHNHPRGNSIPSRNDFDFTTKISNILMQTKINLIDHYIVSESSCHSIITQKSC